MEFADAGVWESFHPTSVPFRNAGSMLPNAPENRERFEWLAASIRARGASILQIQSVDDFPVGKLEELFREKSQSIRAFVSGVTAAATGAIAGAVVILARHSITDSATAVIAALSALILWRWKVPEPFIVACAGVLSFLFVSARFRLKPCFSSNIQEDLLS
jgi:hypothetical protein